jgi:hypothetical protein
MLLFGKIADHVERALVDIVRREHIEQKRFDVKVQGFVVQKQFRQETQILAINLIRFSVDFEKTQIILAVDFFAFKEKVNFMSCLKNQNKTNQADASIRIFPSVSTESHWFSCILNRIRKEKSLATASSRLDTATYTKFRFRIHQTV